MKKNPVVSLVSGISLALSLVGCGAPVEPTGSEARDTAESQGALSGDVYNVPGDTACPQGYTLASPEEAQANAGALCGQLGYWDIARLAGGGSMDGPGYGCGIRDFDSRGLGNTVCVQLSFVEVVGDRPCAPGTTLLTPQEARARQSEVCGKLGYWDIARLAGGGTMDGPGYGCGIRDWDTRGTGNALCRAL